MKYIISGTNRAQSRSLQISKMIQRIYSDLGEKVEILDLCELKFGEMDGSPYTQADLSPKFREFVNKVDQAEGLIIVCPEYNGSYPGALKYFIDHWKYPESFEFRPICLVGLGGRFGGMRPVEHLQQVFGYRNAFLFPLRVFISNIWNMLNEGELNDSTVKDLMVQQAEGFQKFVKALQAARLDSNSRQGLT